MIIEIEDCFGNTIGAVQITNNNDEVIIGACDGDISIADIDVDDIFDTDEEKVRIQLEKRVEGNYENLH